MCTLRKKHIQKIIYEIKWLYIHFLHRSIIYLFGNEEMIEGAFGKKKQDWISASPKDWNDTDESEIKTRRECLRKCAVLAIAWSDGDELVENEQAENFGHCLKKEGFDPLMIEVKGNHDEIWEGGIEVIKALKRVKAHSQEKEASAH